MEQQEGLVKLINLNVEVASKNLRSHHDLDRRHVQ